MLLQAIYKEGLIYAKSGVIVGDIVPADQVQLNLFYSQTEEKRKIFIKVWILLIKPWVEIKLQILGQGMANKWKLKQEK